MKWNYNHFTGVDYDSKTDTKAIFMVRTACQHRSQEPSNREGNLPTDNCRFREMARLGPATWTRRMDRMTI